MPSPAGPAVRRCKGRQEAPVISPPQRQGHGSGRRRALSSDQWHTNVAWQPGGGMPSLPPPFFLTLSYLPPLSPASLGMTAIAGLMPSSVTTGQPAKRAFSSHEHILLQGWLISGPRPGTASVAGRQVIRRPSSPAGQAGQDKTEHVSSCLFRPSGRDALAIWSLPPQPACGLCIISVLATCF